jgi:flagellar biosynthesis/type III secretory pathway protein FliH
LTRRARIVRAPAAAAARSRPLVKPGASEAQRKRIAREEVQAHFAAQRILTEARAKADELVARARTEVLGGADAARRALSEESDAKLAARWLLLRREEQRQLQQDGDRVITLAVALAERLLDASLELGPERIVPLARRVIAEAGGARRAIVEANPLDAEALRAHLVDAAFDLETVEVRESDTLARGELRLHTDVGTIDARLAPRFHRLASALRDVLE